MMWMIYTGQVVKMPESPQCEIRTKCEIPNCFKQLRAVSRQGNYLKGYIDGKDNLEKFEEDLYRETGAKYCVISRQQRDCQSKATKQRYSVSGKFLWESNLGIVRIPYTGVPFTLQSTVHKQCLYGIDKHSMRKNNKENGDKLTCIESQERRTPRQNSIKKGCPACLKIREIELYPDYCAWVSDKLTKWKQRQIRQDRLDKLKTAIEQREVRSLRRFYILVATKDAHINHELNPGTDTGAVPVRNKAKVKKYQALLCSAIEEASALAQNCRDKTALQNAKQHVQKAVNILRAGTVADGTASSMLNSSAKKRKLSLQKESSEKRLKNLSECEEASEGVTGVAHNDADKRVVNTSLAYS